MSTNGERRARCQGCGHAKRNHVEGRGLCLVKSCRLCLAFTGEAPQQVIAKALTERVYERDIFDMAVQNVDVDADAEAVVAALRASGHLVGGSDG
jgi:hypothetical protein